MMPKVETVEDIRALFPKDAESIKTKTQKAIDQAIIDLGNIINIKTEERTFENTMRAYDNMNARLTLAGTILHVIEMTHPEETMRLPLHISRL